MDFRQIAQSTLNTAANVINAQAAQQKPIDWGGIAQDQLAVLENQAKKAPKADVQKWQSQANSGNAVNALTNALGAKTEAKNMKILLQQGKFASDFAKKWGF